MKKLSTWILITLMTIGIISPIMNVSAKAINTTQYQTTANRTITQYITRLENAEYTDDEILTALSKLRTNYNNRKSLSTYKGTRKVQIDTIIMALNNAIAKIENDENASTDIYDDFSQIPVKNTPVTSIYNISGVSSVFTNGVIKTTLNTDDQSSFYKEYDVYLYTPNIKNSQPSATIFIPKPENLIYNYYDSYTITTNFQSETNLDKVKNIRTLAEGYPNISKTTKALSKDSLFTIFGPVSDQVFTRDALNTYENNMVATKAVYVTFFLYIAKNNSEAFTLNYVQSGQRK